MKKIFAIAAMAAMLIACGDEKPENKPQGGNNNGGGDEIEYVDPITIDGEFADWAALNAADVLVAENVEGSLYPGLKVVKIYSDELYVNIYLESNVDLNDETAMAAAYHVNVLLNADNNQETGGYADIWTDAGVDALLQGWIYDGTQYGSYTPGSYAWSGEVGASGWSWNTDEPLVAEENSSIATGAGTLAAYELKINKLKVGLPLASPFTMGVGLTKAWGNFGILPNAAQDATDGAENPNGLAPMFVVK